MRRTRSRSASIWCAWTPSKARRGARLPVVCVAHAGDLWKLLYADTLTYHFTHLTLLGAPARVLAIDKPFRPQRGQPEPRKAAHCALPYSPGDDTTPAKASEHSRTGYKPSDATTLPSKRTSTELERVALPLTFGFVPPPGNQSLPFKIWKHVVKCTALYINTRDCECYV